MAKALNAQQYWVETEYPGTCLCAPTDTGDGIRMGLKYGAAFVGGMDVRRAFTVGRYVGIDIGHVLHDGGVELVEAGFGITADGFEIIGNGIGDGVYKLPVDVGLDRRDADVGQDRRDGVFLFVDVILDLGLTELSLTDMEE